MFRHGFCLIAALHLLPVHAYENSSLISFSGLVNDTHFSTPRGEMDVTTNNGTPNSNFGLNFNPSTSYFVTLPANGITAVIKPSSSSIPSRIQIGDQRSSTYRTVTAKCLNPATLLIEACDLNTVTYPWTNFPANPGTYAYPTAVDWLAGTNTLEVYTVPYGSAGNFQSNGAYLDLPPYVREITVTAFGFSNGDFSVTNVNMADAPSVAKVFSPATVSPGGQSTLTITLHNPGLGADAPGVNLSDVLPAPLTVVSASTTCPFRAAGTGALTAAAGGNTIGLTDALIPVGDCTVTAQVLWPSDSAGIRACAATPSVTNTITPPTQFSTALGQLDTVATADLACTYTSPTVSLTCAPTELFDSPNQISTCTLVSDAPAPAAGLSVNFNLPSANPRYTSTCASPIVIPSGATSATCTITATPNLVVGDGSVDADMSIAAPNSPTEYVVAGSAAKVVVKDDDVGAPATGTAIPVPALTDWGLALLSVLTLGGAVLVRRRV